MVTLKVATADIPPFVYLREVNGTWIMNRGIEAELLHLMSQYLNFSIQLLKCDNLGVKLDNNTWTELFGLIANKNSSLPLIPGSLRPVFTGWLWACLVLTSSYSGCLYSLMSFPTRVKTINTVEELAEAQREHRVRVIATTSDAYYDMIRSLSKSCDKLRSHPGSSYYDNERGECKYQECYKKLSHTKEFKDLNKQLDSLPEETKAKKAYERYIFYL
ncbi:unnamed protein product [Medioppia subpectinata]|uniref:Uncharacterized protein n=1 Tax=Medioppia subpectinata TaxID=1979941 RepID=A0A7R9KW73_9ACAR|nr:unnamed protein product [Medioppia subpectinata]CAG2110818.1 unnamed protein product [Medioppia subpectinata]